LSNVRLALDLCGFRDGEWFSVAAIRDRDIRPGCFNDASQADAFLAQYAGWNHYICGNPVREGTVGKPRLEDVVEARVMLVDADPQSPTADTRSAIAKVATALRGEGVTPYIIDSGRGTQAWVRTTLGPERRRSLSQHLARVGATEGVKFDATHNADRLMRLPGSVNTKTGRTAAVLAQGEGVFADGQFDAMRVPPAALAAAKGSPLCTTPPTEADLLLLRATKDAQSTWDDPAEKGERSKRDFRLVLSLMRAGADESAACRLLYAMPGSKAASDGRGQDYWDATLASVHRHLADEERLRAIAEGLPEASKTDPGAPFEPNALDALLVYRDYGEAAWQRLRQALKVARIPIRALESAMNCRAQEARQIEPVRIRFVADEQKRIGWFKQTREDGWVSVDGTEVRATMRAQGQDPDTEIKSLTDAPWSLVNEPFQPEELEGRRWNKDGAKFAVKPEPGPFPTWQRMLDHVGNSLNPIVLTNEWCKYALVKTGGQYLFKWIAAMFQRPKGRCAYLFLHGPQESGKSTLHEALRMLLARGYVRANHALKSKEGFNGEIANAILCAVEEIDLSDPRRDTHERVKDWVTGEVISVRALYRQAIDYVNTTHWIQAAQKRSFMPVLPGDTRITEIFVEHAEAPVPKDQFMALLAKEAPAFLHAVLGAPLPESTGRLLVPALATAGKDEQAGAAQTELEDWMTSHQWLELSEDAMIGAFLDWLPGASRNNWDRGRVMRELPPTARRDRRLAGALREALRAGPLPASGLLAALGPGPQADWPSVITFGKAMRRVQTLLPWLERVTMGGLDVWRLKEEKK
jgi:hypothetical protein